MQQTTAPLYNESNATGSNTTSSPWFAITTTTPVSESTYNENEYVDEDETTTASNTTTSRIINEIERTAEEVASNDVQTQQEMITDILREINKESKLSQPLAHSETQALFDYEDYYSIFEPETIMIPTTTGTPSSKWIPNWVPSLLRLKYLQALFNRVKDYVEDVFD